MFWSELFNVFSYLSLSYLFTGVIFLFVFVSHWSILITLFYCYSCEFQTASDYVELSNFMTIDRKFRHYCGKHDKFVIQSDDRFFRVSFHSNDRFERTGFQAYFHFNLQHPIMLDMSMTDNSSSQNYISKSNLQHSIAIEIAILMIIFLRIIFNHNLH